MKKKYLVIIFILFLNAFLLAQSKYEPVINSRFTYLLIYQQDSTDINSIGSEVMFLFRGDQFSIFQSKNSYLKDSLFLILKSNPTQSIESLDLTEFPKSKFQYKILKPNKEKELIVFDKIFTDNYRYTEKKEFNWSLRPETAKINGFNCKKATTQYAGRDYIAWYTVEIPISDGPYKFNGLPGLIIKIADTKGHYNFELLSVSNIKEYEYPYLPTKNKIISTNKETYFIKLKEYRENIFNRISESGFTLDEENISKVKEKLKKQNNPIERFKE